MLRFTLRTVPVDSATRMDEPGETRSTTAARILDLSWMGVPYLLDDLAALLALFCCSALFIGRRLVSTLVVLFCLFLIGVNEACLDSLGLEEMAGV